MINKVQLTDLVINHLLSISEPFQSCIVMKMLFHCEKLKECIIMLGAISNMLSKLFEVVCELLSHDLDSTVASYPIWMSKGSEGSRLPCSINTEKSKALSIANTKRSSLDSHDRLPEYRRIYLSESVYLDW